MAKSSQKRDAAPKKAEDKAPEAKAAPKAEEKSGGKKKAGGKK